MKLKTVKISAQLEQRCPEHILGNAARDHWTCPTGIGWDSGVPKPDSNLLTADLRWVVRARHEPQLIEQPESAPEAAAEREPARDEVLLSQ
jgi:hypothetical protein